MTVQTPTETDRLLIEANGLDPDALQANRAGSLTSAQARCVRSKRRGRGNALIVFAALGIVLGGWHLLSGHEGPEGDRFGAFMAVLLGGVLLALRFSDFGRSYAAEVAAGRVSSVEGFVRIKSSSGDSHTSYWYQIEGREFGTTEEGAKAIDARSRYRIFCVPDSDIMVNIESLGPALVGSGPRQGTLLMAEEITAIVGEPMRTETETSHAGSGAWPGAIVAAFASTTTGLHIGVQYLLGAQDSSTVGFYRRMLARGPGARSVSGLGDEATYCRGQLLVRRGETFISVNLMSLENPAALFASERSFDIARRVAALALQTVR